MKKKYLAYTLLMSLSGTCLATSVDDVRWIAQNYKPYSYMEDNSKKGMIIEIVGAVLKKLDSKKTINDIEIETFSRSFVRRNNDPNTVFFPLAKAPDREKYFKWVGPIIMDEPVLFAKKSKNIKINNDGDLKSYKIGAKEGYSAVKILKNMGVKNSSLQLNDTDVEGLEKISQDKLDLIACDRLSCIAAMKDNKINPQDYDIVYKMQGSELSFAFNKDTDSEVIDKVSKAFEEVKKSKEYNDITKRYLD